MMIVIADRAHAFTVDQRRAGDFAEGHAEALAPFRRTVATDQISIREPVPWEAKKR